MKQILWSVLPFCDMMGIKQNGIFGYEMYRHGQQFYGGDGVVSRGIENTIRNIAILGRDGMRETARQILGIMLES